MHTQCVGIAGARRQRQSSDYYLVTPTIELQLTQIDSPPRLAPSRPRTSGVVSLWMNRRRVGGDVSDRLTLLVRFLRVSPPAFLLPLRRFRCRRLLEEFLVLWSKSSGGLTM